jgi:hypothetical protein
MIPRNDFVYGTDWETPEFKAFRLQCLKDARKGSPVIYKGGVAPWHNKVFFKWSIVKNSMEVVNNGVHRRFSLNTLITVEHENAINMHAKLTGEDRYYRSNFSPGL